MLYACYVKTGFQSSHKTETTGRINLHAEALDEAPNWCNRVVIMKRTGPKTSEVIAQYDWDSQ